MLALHLKLLKEIAMAFKRMIAINSRGNSLLLPMLVIIACMLLTACNQGWDKNGKHVKAKESGNGEKLLLNRPGYVVAYPDNWHIDSTSKLYDIDGHFTLHSGVESGLITFFIFNIQKDEVETLNRQVKVQLENSMKDGTVSYFTKWGNYVGHGAILKGKMSGVWKSEIKIFVYGTKEQSFLITSICADGYRDDVLAGLNLIESTFKLKQPMQVRVPANHS